MMNFRSLNWIKYPPKFLRDPLIRIRIAINGIFFHGMNRFCPICGKHSIKFGRAGLINKRDDAKCLMCGSIERYRFVWLYFKNMTDLFDGKLKIMLHVAPEACFEKKLRKIIGEGYITADLYDPRVQKKMDITEISYPDESVDVIYCSHVLEHVQDDHKAIREFYRILKKGGYAIILVPISGKKTIEDSSVQNPKDRLKVFGQKDHVRRYGPDFINRLIESGFDVEKIIPSDFIKEGMINIFGLNEPSCVIFHCRKF